MINGTKREEAMADRKQLTWTGITRRPLRAGWPLLLAAGIFYVTGSNFLGTKYRLTTYLPEGRGGVRMGRRARGRGWKSETWKSISADAAGWAQGKPLEKKQKHRIIWPWTSGYQETS